MEDVDNKLSEVEMAKGYLSLAEEMKEFVRLSEGIAQEVIPEF